MSNANGASSSITAFPIESSMPTGMPHGGTGAVVHTSSPLKTALEAMDSDQVRREAGALLEQCAPSLRRVVSQEYELVGYRADKPLTPEQRAQIQTLSRNLTRPSDRQFVTQEVTRCLSLTKSRSKDEADLTLMLAAFTEELVKFPPDLVSWSLRKWAGAETWWPSLAEIMAPIKKEMAWRNSLDSAANTVVNQTQSDGQKSSWSTMSEDRKARINETLKRAGVGEPIE